MKGMMYQLIAGVAELHKEGIVHRDIKPSNILLNTEVVPKLLVADFSSGLQNTPIFEAQLLYSSRGPTTDEESLIYAPPEVLLAIDEDIDGMCLYDVSVMHFLLCMFFCCLCQVRLARPYHSILRDQNPMTFGV